MCTNPTILQHAIFTTRACNRLNRFSVETRPMVLLVTASAIGSGAFDPALGHAMKKNNP